MFSLSVSRQVLQTALAAVVNDVDVAAKADKDVADKDVADEQEPCPHLLVFGCTAGRHRSAYMTAVACRLLQSRGIMAKPFWPSLAADRNGNRGAKDGKRLRVCSCLARCMCCAGGG